MVSQDLLALSGRREIEAMTGLRAYLEDPD
jgi:hypothetical protein